MSNADARKTANGRSGAAGRAEDPEFEKTRRRLQRIVRGPELGRPSLSGGTGVFEPRRMSEQQKAATLSPKLVNPVTANPEDEVQYQCTECDMIVRGSDPYCPFCGAVFADGAVDSGGAAGEVAEKPSSQKPAKQEVYRPEKFDIFSLLNARSRSKDLLYQEALTGFVGSASLLEEIERLVTEVSALGTDTSKARRLIGSAWEACREGDWNMVSHLAKQTEELISPSVPELVRSELAKAREYLTQAKASGIDISDYIVRVKSAMHSLHSDDPDEALRLTKELMDMLREDSVSWSKRVPIASSDSLRCNS